MTRTARLILLAALAAPLLRLGAQDTRRLTWHIEAAYSQARQHEARADNPRLHYYGGSVGAVAEYEIPRASVLRVRAGAVYSLQYGRNTQSYPLVNNAIGRTEYISYRNYMHNLTVPVDLMISIRVWRGLRVFALGGPRLRIGLAHTSKTDAYLTDATAQVMRDTYGYTIGTATTDLYTTDRHDALRRLNMQLGAGGGVEYKRWRLQGGYDWGVSDIGRGSYRKLTDHWHAGISYTL